MLAVKAILLLCVLTKFRCNGEFVIPDITLEAYSPKGFRASIPALDGIQMFAFHANVNKEIAQVDPGEYNRDFTSATGNTWSYDNPDLTLKVGDKIYYWVFIQYEKLGYRKDNQKWTVEELVKVSDKPCQPSRTTVSGKSLICKDDIIFDENFNGQAIDTGRWTIEQYIPAYYMSSDYEFVSYQNKKDVCYVTNNRLYIKPKTLNDLNGELDFRGSCTRSSDDQCYLKSDVHTVIPPVISARIVSNFKFKYGNVEIQAKLPAGDWIYPQVYLEQVNEPKNRLWIAYARGNVHLKGNNDEEIGGQLLFGGPVLTPDEPERSQYLKSVRNSKPYTSDMHIYTVVWSNDVKLLIDGEKYGEISEKTMEESGFGQNDMVRIVLGLGVGGVNDFPENFVSGNTQKPWSNRHYKQVKQFFNAKNTWIKTWTGDKSALQVDYVKVWAV